AAGRDTGRAHRLVQAGAPPAPARRHAAPLRHRSRLQERRGHGRQPHRPLGREGVALGEGAGRAGRPARPRCARRRAHVAVFLRRVREPDVRARARRPAERRSVRLLLLHARPPRLRLLSREPRQGQRRPLVPLLPGARDEPRPAAGAPRGAGHRPDARRADPHLPGLSGAPARARGKPRGRGARGAGRCPPARGVARQGGVGARDPPARPHRARLRRLQPALARRARRAGEEPPRPRRAVAQERRPLAGRARRPRRGEPGPLPRRASRLGSAGRRREPGRARPRGAPRAGRRAPRRARSLHAHRRRHRRALARPRRQGRVRLGRRLPHGGAARGRAPVARRAERDRGPRLPRDPGDRPAPLLVQRGDRQVRVTLVPKPYPVRLPELPGPPKVGSAAPPLKVAAYRGTLPERLGGEKGRLLFFWATWCAPCKASLPELLAFEQERGVQVIAITDEPAEQLGPFFEKFTSPFPATVAVDELRRAFQAYGVSGTPTFVLVDEDGKVASASTGYTPEKGLGIEGWSWSKRAAR